MRDAWLDAVTIDPLVPGPILPADHLGQPAWRREVEVVRDAGRQLRTFNPEKTGAGRAWQDNFMLHMQHEVGHGNRATVG